jgi:fructose/tagatose bisphosphate aldolase
VADFLCDLTEEISLTKSAGNVRTVKKTAKTAVRPENLQTGSNTIIKYKTGVDILAVGIGTAHGFYKGKPEINFRRLEEVNEALDIPLVLHGGTGIPEADVRRAIKCGINKVNVGTIVKYTYLSSVKETLDREGPTIHTIDLMLPAVEKIKEEIKLWIKVCMSEGKA